MPQKKPEKPSIGETWKTVFGWDVTLIERTGKAWKGIMDNGTVLVVFQGQLKTLTTKDMPKWFKTK